MNNRKISFRVHAIQRMFERQISRSDVEHVLRTGEMIEEYMEDKPYPSRLVLGWHGSRPLHVVVADNALDNQLIVITVYEPDPTQWGDNFMRRKK